MHEPKTKKDAINAMVTWKQDGENVCWRCKETSLCSHDEDGWT